ncbi:MAG: hypothetical protein WCJ19_04380 [bacterium]
MPRIYAVKDLERGRYEWELGSDAVPIADVQDIPGKYTTNTLPSEIFPQLSNKEFHLELIKNGKGKITTAILHIAGREKALRIDISQKGVKTGLGDAMYDGLTRVYCYLNNQPTK